MKGRNMEKALQEFAKIHPVYTELVDRHTAVQEYLQEPSQTDDPVAAITRKFLQQSAA